MYMLCNIHTCMKRFNTLIALSKEHKEDSQSRAKSIGIKFDSEHHQPHENRSLERLERIASRRQILLSCERLELSI